MKWNYLYGTSEKMTLTTFQGGGKVGGSLEIDVFNRSENLGEPLFTHIKAMSVNLD